ncbi:MAG: hypothetical protein LC803_10470 [Acidobacteria bacterium]|nr:hypothetical protein [Acidobacteriota bacterium]
MLVSDHSVAGLSYLLPVALPLSDEDTDSPAPVYRRADSSWPPIPTGCVEGLLCRAEQSGVVVREWKRVIGYTEARTRDEGLVWIVAHEAFHFLRHTRQIKGRNMEIEADQFADEQLHLLRRLRERWSLRQSTV